MSSPNCLRSSLQEILNTTVDDGAPCAASSISNASYRGNSTNESTSLPVAAAPPRVEKKRSSSIPLIATAIALTVVIALLINRKNEFMNRKGNDRVQQEEYEDHTYINDDPLFQPFE